VRTTLGTVFVLLFLLTGCGGGSTKSTCVAGMSIACVGPAGCQGGQICKADGTGYEACICGSGTDGGGGAPAAGASGKGGAAGGGTAGSGGAAGSAGGAAGSAGGAAGSAGGAAGSAGGAAGGAAQPPLAGLTIWLQAGKGVTTADGGAGVATWADQSGNGNDATSAGGTPVTQTTVNGHPALHFALFSSRMAVATGPGITWGSGPFLLELVFRHTTAVNQRPVFWVQFDPTTVNLDELLIAGNTGKTAQSDIFARVDTSLSTFDLPTNPAINYNDNSLHSIGLRRDNLDSFELLVDGTVAGTMSGSGVLTPSGFVTTIGSFDGDLLEVVGKNALVSDTDVATLETYFRTKYGTP
jgi:hypothetical protein